MSFPALEGAAIPDAERYDAVVIGSGEGGKYLAWHLARAQQKTAAVERRRIGGSCPNINRLPQHEESGAPGRPASLPARQGSA